MNRKLLFTSLVLAATCFLSCSKTEMDPAITPGDESSLPEIILSTSGTKAYLDGTAVKWQAGDALFVADATRTTESPVARKFDLIDGAGTTTAKFKGHGYECDKVPYWIFYPYWDSFNVIKDSGDDKYLAGYVPIGQITTGGTPSKTALVAAAYAPGEGDDREGYSHGTFTLKFLVGFLKFTVPAGQNKITRVRIQSGDDGDANRPAMSGLFKVNYPKGDDENWNKASDFPEYGGNLAITGYAQQYYVWAAHNGTSVTGAEECSKAVPFTAGKEYYLAVLAKDYSKLKIETSYQTTDLPSAGYYTSWGSTDTRTVSGTITVQPGKIVDLGELTYVSSETNRTVSVSLKPAANDNVNAIWPTSNTNGELTVAYYSDSKNMTTVNTAVMTVTDGVASFNATIPKNSRKIHVIYPAGNLAGTAKPADDFVPNPGTDQIMPSSGGGYAFSLNNYPIHAVKDVPVGSGTDVSNIELIDYSLDGPESGDTYNVSSTIVKFDFSKAAIANCDEKINGLTVNGYSSHFVDNSTTQVAVSASQPVLISLPNTTTQVNTLSVINPYRAEYDCDYTTLPSGSSYTAPTWTAGAVSSSSVVLSVKSRTVRIYASENNIIDVFAKLHPKINANNGLSASDNKYVYAAKDAVKIQGGNYTLSEKLEIPHGYTISGGWDDNFSSQTDRDADSGGTVIDCGNKCQGIWVGGTMANYPISISNLKIINANSTSYAGGLYAGSNQAGNEYKKLTFATCVAATGGGAIFSFAGTFDDIKCSSCSAGPFSNSGAHGCGGAMYLKGNGTTLVENCEISSCQTNGDAPSSGTSYLYGGGIYAHGGYVTIQNTKVSSCTAAERGGGVYLQSGAKLILDGASVDPASYPITGNHAQYGGGLYVDGSNCEVHGVSSNILLQISGNTALLEGAGIYLNNGSKAYCCDVTGNNWSDNTRYMRGGGAVVTNGSRLYRSRINNNASCQAAGVYLIKTGYVFNCLITNNTAQKGTYGSAIGLNSTVETGDSSRESDDIVVYNNTICNNRITDNDGIQVAVGVYRVSSQGTGPSRIQNNIILNNNGYNNVSCFALSYSIAAGFSSVNLAYNNVVKTNTPWPTTHASLATFDGNITVGDETSVVNVSGDSPDFKVSSSATVKEGTGYEYETKMSAGFDTDFWGNTLSAPKKYIGCEYFPAQ